MSAQSAVSVPSGIRIELQPRGLNDSTYRIGFLQDYQPSVPNAPKLKSGMYLMAAIQGRSRVSFFKLAEPIVRKELDRLQDSSSEYLLLVSETPSSYVQVPIPPPPLPLQGNSFSMKNLSVFTPAPPSHSPSRHARQPLSPQKSLQEEEYGEGEEDEEDFDRASFPSSAGGGGGGGGQPEATFLESVERLRAQRRAVEQIKRESAQKSLRIENLEYEFQAKLGEIAELQEENLSLQRVAWQAGVSEEALDQEKQRVFQLELEINSLRAQNKAYEDSASELLSLEKKQLLDSQLEWQTRVEETKLENKELTLRLEEAVKSIRQANLEREASEAREETARRAYDRLCVDQREREIKLEHTLERTRQERDRVIKRAEELDLALQTSRNLANNHHEALDAAREQLFLAGKQQDELQVEMNALRLQVEEREAACLVKTKQAQVDVDKLQRDLELQQTHLRQAKDDAEKFRNKLEEEIRQHRTTKDALLRAEGLQREAVEASERAQRHAKTSTERLGEMTKTKEALHDRLVRALEKGNALADEVEQERMAGKALAESRLDLLAQFVEEERRLDGALFQQPLTVTAASSLLPRKPASGGGGGVRGRLEFASPGSKSTQSHTSVAYTPQSAYSYSSSRTASSQPPPSQQQRTNNNKSNHLV
ncbi:hypothetical protein BASA81_003515 [Batrachochytrium salamandrivorans]|nr:hypothetical protein BASA81_003515 [Batrachochytrium salamandrivorans]